MSDEVRITAAHKEEVLSLREKCCRPTVTMRRSSKKYSYFVGNYGGSWWHRNNEFESVN